MTHGEIYAKAYKLKTFQLWELIEELSKDWGFLGRKFIKDRVSGWLAIQLRHGALLKVSDKPPVFTFPEFAERWKEYLRLKTCPVCGKEFLPHKSQTLYCSPSCANKKYAKEKWQKVRPEKRTPRRWTPAELQLLREKVNEKGKLTAKDLKALALILGRSFKAVQHKYYEEVRR